MLFTNNHILDSLKIGKKIKFEYKNEIKIFEITEESFVKLMIVCIIFIFKFLKMMELKIFIKLKI